MAVALEMKQVASKVGLLGIQSAACLVGWMEMS